MMITLTHLIGHEDNKHLEGNNPRVVFGGVVCQAELVGTYKLKSWARRTKCKLGGGGQQNNPFLLLQYDINKCCVNYL